MICRSHSTKPSKEHLQQQRPSPLFLSLTSQHSILFWVSCMIMVFLSTFDVVSSADPAFFYESGSACWTKTPRNIAAAKDIEDVYTIGVLAIRGFEAAYNEFNTTFSNYLTATAGQRFDPPIRFEMKPLNFLSLFTDVEDGLVDFIYVNPSAYSCIESEHDAESLVSQISRRNINGNIYDLKRFGGVIATRADRDDIQHITDLKDKIIAAASISGLGSGQMQFRAMRDVGMSWINDPKQLVFTSNQGSVVNGVLNGDFDVGFIRTDQIERTKYPNGTKVDASLLKVIDPVPGLNIGGMPFPFESSTPLYPEWNIGALSHVHEFVSREVQSAMIRLKDHAALGRAIEKCETMNINNINPNFCETELVFPRDFTRYLDGNDFTSYYVQCDTTWDNAKIALEAMTDGRYAGWTTSLSYLPLRSMQEATGFVSLDTDTNVWRCVRSAELYDSIVCPDGLLKKSKEEVNNGCSGDLVCQEGFQCVCQPCYELFDCEDSIEMFGRCVRYQVLLSSILVPMAVLSVGFCVFVMQYKSHQLIIQAEKSAQNERELNEFIAHEVRNPLSAALSACSFVNANVQGEEPITEEVRSSLREDFSIIESSLRFINDLLRSMLDVNRASNNQMVLDHKPVSILHDIFEPVSSLIYNRDTNFEVIVECDEALVVHTDRLRLQQVVLNLARNAAKFVDEGFVRLRADVIEETSTSSSPHVHLYIEDSGPGIPEEKRPQMFSRYQQSLDTLAQGTGVGLNLCQKLIQLMNGEIWLNEKYVSGFKDQPGACIVVNLKKSPVPIPPEPTSLSNIFSVLTSSQRSSGREQSTTTTNNNNTKNENSLFANQAVSTRTVFDIQTENVNRKRFDPSLSDIESKSAATPDCGDFSIKSGISIPLAIPGTPTATSKSSVANVEETPAPTPPPPVVVDSNPATVKVEPSLLPDHLRVLFVDDDRILRKQGTRAIGRLKAEWTVREAASGETALQLVEKESFDLIFMDQYMTSVEQTLKGTETVRALRSRGCKSIICGLSANYLEPAFISSGADAFMLKPFPCKKDELHEALVSLLTKRGGSGGGGGGGGTVTTDEASSRTTDSTGKACCDNV